MPVSIRPLNQLQGLSNYHSLLKFSLQTNDKMLQGLLREHFNLFQQEELQAEIKAHYCAHEI